MADSTPCWFTDCTVTIPTVTRYVPIEDGSRYVEEQQQDDSALLAHLSTHKPKPRSNPWWRP